MSGPPVSASVGRRFAAVLLDAVLYYVTLLIGWLIWALIVAVNAARRPASSSWACAS